MDDPHQDPPRSRTVTGEPSYIGTGFLWGLRSTGRTPGGILRYFGYQAAPVKGINRRCSLKHKLADLPADDFAAVCRSSQSIAKIMGRIGLSSHSSAYSSIRARALREGVDLSHIPRGLSHRKGQPSPNRVSLEHALRSGNRSQIKKVLLRDSVLKNECSVCGMPPEWNAQPLVLRLDHINGTSTDHTLTNLRLVCPNCDSQLPTFAGRNRKARIRTTCIDCGTHTTKNSLRCSRCENIRKQETTPTKIKWPDRVSLQTLLANASVESVARTLGVSGNAIRKHLRKHLR